MDYSISEVKNSVIEFNQKYSIFRNCLTALSIISAYYAAFVSFFDIRALVFIDATSTIKHLLGMGLLYVIISSVFKIVFSIKYSFPEPFYLGVFQRNTTYTTRLLRTKTILIHFCSTLVFTIFHAGFDNALMLFFIVGVIWGFVGLFLSIALACNKFVLCRVFKGYNLAESTTSSFNVIKGEFFIVVLSFAIGLGFARADNLKNANMLSVNDSDKKLVMIMSTSSGPVFNDINKSSVLFVPWESIESVQFIKTSVSFPNAFVNALNAKRDQIFKKTTEFANEYLSVELRNNQQRSILEEKHSVERIHN